MVFIATVLGAFYLASALMVLRRVRLEWMFGHALDAQTSGTEPGRYRIAFMAASAALYGIAGMALMARSGWAVWLLGAGLIVQAAYYGAARLFLKAEAPAGDPRWTKALTAAIVSTAAFAFAAYAARSGVLS